MSKKVVRILTMLGVIFFLFKHMIMVQSLSTEYRIQLAMLQMENIILYIVEYQEEIKKERMISAEELLFFMALEEYVVLFLLEHFQDAEKDKRL